MSNKIAIVPQLFLATLLGSGFCFPIMLIVLWVYSFIPGERIVHEEPTFADSLVLLTDGTPLIARRTDFGKAWKDKNNISSDDNVILFEQRSSPDGIAYSTLSFHTIDGKIVALKKSENSAGQQLAELPARDKSNLYKWQLKHQALKLFSQNDNNASAFWYFIHNGKLKGQGYFVGYDVKTKLCIGYIGPNGFSNDIPNNTERFPFDGPVLGNYELEKATLFDPDAFPNGIQNFNKTILISPDEAFEINFKEMKVTSYRNQQT